MPNSCGLVCCKNKIAQQDSEAVKNMREAGAILTCLTNLSEVCLFMESRNNLYGRTNNAYNVSRSVDSLFSHVFRLIEKKMLN